MSLLLHSFKLTEMLLNLIFVTATSKELRAASHRSKQPTDPSSVVNIFEKSFLFAVRIVGKIIQTVGGNDYAPKRKKTSHLISSTITSSSLPSSSYFFFFVFLVVDWFWLTVWLTDEVDERGENAVAFDWDIVICDELTEDGLE